MGKKQGFGAREQQLALKLAFKAPKDTCHAGQVKPLIEAFLLAQGGALNQHFYVQFDDAPFLGENKHHKDVFYLDPEKLIEEIRDRGQRQDNGHEIVRELTAEPKVVLLRKFDSQKPETIESALAHMMAVPRGINAYRYQPIEMSGKNGKIYPVIPIVTLPEGQALSDELTKGSGKIGVLSYNPQLVVSNKGGNPTYILRLDIPNSQSAAKWKPMENYALIHDQLYARQKRLARRSDREFSA